MKYTKYTKYSKSGHHVISNKIISLQRLHKDIKREKEEVLNEMGVKIIFADNVYQGGDPIVGFMYNGKQYALKTHHHYDIDGIFEQITTGNIQSQEFVSPAELGFGRFYIKEAGGKSNFLN